MIFDHGAQTLVRPPYELSGSVGAGFYCFRFSFRAFLFFLCCQHLPFFLLVFLCLVSCVPPCQCALLAFFRDKFLAEALACPLCFQSSSPRRCSHGGLVLTQSSPFFSPFIILFLFRSFFDFSHHLAQSSGFLPRCPKAQLCFPPGPLAAVTKRSRVLRASFMRMDTEHRPPIAFNEFLFPPSPLLSLYLLLLSRSTCAFSACPHAHITCGSDRRRFGSDPPPCVLSYPQRPALGPSPHARPYPFFSPFPDPVMPPRTRAFLGPGFFDRKKAALPVTGQQPGHALLLHSPKPLLPRLSRAFWRVVSANTLLPSLQLVSRFWRTLVAHVVASLFPPFPGSNLSLFHCGVTMNFFFPSPAAPAPSPSEHTPRTHRLPVIPIYADASSPLTRTT